MELENSVYESAFLCNDENRMLKIMIVTGIIIVTIGMSLIAFGCAAKNEVGYIVGGIFLTVSTVIFAIALVVIFKNKKQTDNNMKTATRNLQTNAMSLNFLSKKETSFERNYFDHSTMSYYVRSENL